MTTKDNISVSSREEKLETALNLILFELSTMPPLPNMIRMPFGITNSIKIAQDALRK